MESRTKYPEVDTFRFSGIIFNLSLVLMLGLMTVLVNWTTYERPQTAFTDLSVEIPDEIIVEPPRTQEPPKPPPPPPPTLIEEVPDKLVTEEEVEFVDQSLEAETEVIAPVETPKSDAPAPPPPPPPPPPQPKVEEIFKIVEDMPRFPGCEDLGLSKDERKKCADKKLYEFIYQHLKYPPLARENNVEGLVVVQFVVEKDGTVTGAKVVRDIGAGCGDAALQVVLKMNEMPERWTPGKQRGRPVRVMFNLPVRFKLVTS
ncbi:MAG: energy transducer TonB [Bacteroidetes bacterium]|nr:MAG: energy transducer TonB [Bacteroidota bacterium]